MIYLALPYKHPSLERRNWRYQRAKAALFGLWDKGEAAICPVVIGHEYSERQRTGPKVQSQEFWMSMALAQMVACTRIYVLTLPEWEESTGLADEIRLGFHLRKTIIGYQPFVECQDVSGLEILKEFGLTPGGKL